MLGSMELFVGTRSSPSGGLFPCRFYQEGQKELEEVGGVRALYPNTLLRRPLMESHGGVPAGHGDAAVTTGLSAPHLGVTPGSMPWGPTAPPPRAGCWFPLVSFPPRGQAVRAVPGPDPSSFPQGWRRDAPWGLPRCPPTPCACSGRCWYRLRCSAPSPGPAPPSIGVSEGRERNGDGPGGNIGIMGPWDGLGCRDLKAPPGMPSTPRVGDPSMGCPPSPPHPGAGVSWVPQRGGTRGMQRAPAGADGGEAVGTQTPLGGGCWVHPRVPPAPAQRLLCPHHGPRPCCHFHFPMQPFREVQRFPLLAPCPRGRWGQTRSLRASGRAWNTPPQVVPIGVMDAPDEHRPMAMGMGSARSPTGDDEQDLEVTAGSWGWCWGEHGGSSAARFLCRSCRKDDGG